MSKYLQGDIYPSFHNNNYTFKAAPQGTYTYTIECWGAAGGNANSNKVLGGKGGYATGTKSATSSTTWYIYVGGAGTQASADNVATGGYNGGGDARSTVESFGSGGGCTHIATTKRGVLKNYESYKNEILIVAAGGGGAGYWANGPRSNVGGYGGGTTGGSTPKYPVDSDAYVSNGYGGTQTSGGKPGSYNDGSSYEGGPGSFGQGGTYKTATTTTNKGPGGGGGYYGGGSAGGYGSSGGGGSSYFGGVTNGSTIAGNATQTKPGGGTETGHSGNGYARITLIRW